MGIRARTWGAVCLAVCFPATAAAAASPPAESPPAPTMQVSGTIAGQVTDAQTMGGMASVQLYIAGTGYGALSGSSGRFIIAGVPAGIYTLRAQSIGYAMQDQTITVAEGETVVVNFSLSQQAISLDELVVTATGEQRSREIATSLSRVTSREIEVTPARNAQDLLMGRAPGATVLQNSGQPGTGSTIVLRGNNSISQGNDPIVYVDGVRIYGGTSPLQPQARQSASPLNDINPADIERVEIVKGPAATTLYGTEASGGVIQIFTKRGQTGKAQWSLELTEGVNRAGRLGTDADPTGMWLRQCRGPNNVSSDGKIFVDVTCPESGSWLQTGITQQYALSVRGGTETMDYYVSGSFSDDEGIIYQAGGSAGGGLSANFGFRPIDGLEVRLSSSLTRRSTDWVPSGDNGDGFLLNVSRGFGSNFTGAAGCEAGVICVQNGAVLDLTNTSKATHFITGMSAVYKPGDRVTNRFTVGYDFNTSEIETIRPFGYPRYPLGDMVSRNWRRALLSMDYVGTLENAFRGGSLTSAFSWGGQLFADDAYTLSIDAFDFSGPGNPTLTSAARRDVTTDSRLRVTNAGFFGQETLALNDRLFLTAGARVDGNSAFGSGFGLQFYPKLSASYVLSDEDFWNFDWWEVMKLRAAMGESGKAPGAFDAVRTWTPIAGENGQPGFTPGDYGNSELGPERSREYEIGFEAGIFDGKLGLDLTYYNATTMDALIPVRRPPSNGFLGTQLENVGEIRNTGFEARVSFDILRREGIDWKGRVDFSTVKSEAIDLDGQEITVQTFGRTYIKEGYPVPGVFGLKMTNPDAFADPIWEENAYIGDLYPTKSIGLNTNVKLLDRVLIDAVGEFKYGGHMINANGYQNGRRGAWFPCYEIQAKYRELGTNPSAYDDVTALERARCALNGGRVAPTYDAWIESTDFFKLRSVSITYELPSGWVPGTRTASVQLAGRNLWTVTDYTGSDPELDDYRTSLARRDYYVLPTFRTFLASVRVTF